MSVMNTVGATDALTLTEAASLFRVPGEVFPLAARPGNPARPAWTADMSHYTPMAPLKLFDQLYFVGTTTVGAFVIDTGEGLIMLDTGCGEADGSLMAADIKKLGLEPSRIRMLMISHEHFDHYGGVPYLKEHVCPEAKVAMSLVGWNMLQTVPQEWAYMGPRPQAVDIGLTDGMKLKLGHTVIQIVATPGHSPGCLSFIIPVTDNGNAHTVGIMGGMAVWRTPLETWLYKSSVEYFKAFAMAARCDTGLSIHAQEEDFAALRVRKAGEPHPLVIGTEKFDTLYLEKYREIFRGVLHSGKMMPYPA